MRLIWLPITGRTTNTVTVSAPINANIAPPGYYMIHVLDGSLVPSTARIIQIPGTGADHNPPGQVTGLTVTPVYSGRTQLNLAWSANTEPDVHHYNVYRSTTPGFTVTPGTTAPIARPTTNSYMDKGRTPGTTYYYRVAAVDNAGNNGTPSVEASGTTSAADIPPAKVTGLTVTPAAGTASSTQLNLAWTANTEPDLLHYKVYRGTTPGFTVIPGTTLPVATPTTNSYMDKGRTPGTTYYYRVAARDNAGYIGISVR